MTQPRLKPGPFCLFNLAGSLEHPTKLLLHDSDCFLHHIMIKGLVTNLLDSSKMCSSQPCLHGMDIPAIIGNTDKDDIDMLYKGLPCSLEDALSSMEYNREENCMKDPIPLLSCHQHHKLALARLVEFSTLRNASRSPSKQSLDPGYETVRSAASTPPCSLECSIITSTRALQDQTGTMLMKKTGKSRPGRLLTRKRRVFNLPGPQSVLITCCDSFLQEYGAHKRARILLGVGRRARSMDNKS